jgi:ABC-type sugar transport system permease subunit
MEKLTVKKSLARAQYLVKGNFWRVFLITLFCVLVAGLIGFFTSFIENAFTSQEGAMYLIGFFITRLIFVLPVSYILIVFALTYSELKLAKDEYDIEKAASIFD